MEEVFGKVVSYVYVVESQKRGLPRAHILITLSVENKIKFIEDIDEMISAEIPDSNIDKTLHDIVIRQMVHGPCGHENPECVCMVDQHCIKNFPKEYQQSTIQGTNSYPNYKRRSQEQGGQQTIKNNKIIDNKWIVPYNPYLLKKYNAHINVEICGSFSSIKYLFKYVFKGYDMTEVRTEITSMDFIDEVNNQEGHDNDNNYIDIHHHQNDNFPNNNNQNTLAPGIEIDEIKNFVNARYVGPSEAFWRIYGFPLSEVFPPVVRLTIHLPDEQNITYVEGNESQAISENGSDSMLMNISRCTNNY